MRPRLPRFSRLVCVIPRLALLLGIVGGFSQPLLQSAPPPALRIALEKAMGLAPNEPIKIRDSFSAVVDFTAEGDDWRTFILEVDNRVTSVRLWTTDATGNIDLYARFGSGMTHYAEAEFRADGDSSNEELLLHREDSPALRTGTYYVDLARTEPLPRRVRFFVEYVRRTLPHPRDPFANPAVDDDGSPVAVIEGDARLVIPFWNTEQRWRTVEIEVGKKVRRLDVRALGSRDDLDLYLSTDGPIADWDTDAEFTSAWDSWNESIAVTPEKGRYLASGTYYLDLVNYLESTDFGPVELIVQYDSENEPAPPPAIVGPVRPIELGVRESFSVNLEHRQGRTFSFLVPNGTQSIHARIYNATRDLDLFLRQGSRVTQLFDEEGYNASSAQPRLDERLDLFGTTEAPLAAGTWYLDVASLTELDLKANFDLIVTLNEPPARDRREYLRPLPSQDDPFLSPLEAALLANAEVACDNGIGSASCLSPQGILLTNYHVLQGDGTFQTKEIYVSFPLELDDVPQQMFRAEVLEADKYLDLALLRIVGDLDGEPLPEGYVFPSLRIGNSDAARLGEDIWVAGFPAVGGEESRISLSLMRGVVTGFQKDATGSNFWIKTDASINSGNSGGMMLDASSLELIGIPSQTVFDDFGELGYARPTNRIPERWLEHLK
jgi:S1-C subfamily serine protease